MAKVILMSGGHTAEPTRNLRNAPHVTIRSVSAHIDDSAAIGRLLAGVPHGERIRPHLSRPLLLRKWHEPTGQGFCIASDATRVRCVAVSGLSAREIRVVWMRLEDILTHADFVPTACRLRDLVETELDVVAYLVN
jgi:hypothetical protein